MSELGYIVVALLWLLSAGLFGFLTIRFIAPKWVDRQYENKRLKLQNDYEKRENELEIELIKRKREIQEKINTEFKKVVKETNALRDELKSKIENEMLSFKEKEISKTKDYLDLKVTNLKEVYLLKENKIKENFSLFEEKMLAEELKVENEIADLKKKEFAAMQARIRQYEEQDKESFYMIKLSESKIADIEQLHAILPKLNNPLILKKYIFSDYYRSPVKDLISRVTEGKKISGIYKITYVKTGQCYIGQSVDIGNRWMQHCKRGAGVDTPTAIKLYPAMREHGIHNFKFEIIEAVEQDKLSSREKYWGEYFGAKVFGYSIKN